MARPSKLTDKQWQEITDRVLNGESKRSLAKEYGIAESSIREKVSAQCEEIKNVAHQLVAAECAVKKLNLPAQVSAHNLASKLMSMSYNMADTGNKGAAIASRLSTIAEKHMGFVETAAYDNNLESMMEGVKTVNAIMRTANESSALAVDLLKANKEAVDSMNKPQDERPKTLNDFYN